MSIYTQLRSYGPKFVYIGQVISKCTPIQFNIDPLHNTLTFSIEHLSLTARTIQQYLLLVTKLSLSPLKSNNQLLIEYKSLYLWTVMNTLLRHTWRFYIITFYGESWRDPWLLSYNYEWSGVCGKLSWGQCGTTCMERDPAGYVCGTLRIEWILVVSSILLLLDT